MPMMNRMTDLLDLIESRLGTKLLNLPDTLSKDVWADQIIEKQTLRTFSRYLPHAITYYLTPDRKKGPYYLIDEKVAPSIDIMGVGDVVWDELSKSNPGWGYGSASYFSTFDFFSSNLSADDIGMYQMLVDHTSAFRACGLYLKFIPPNMIKLESAMSNNLFDFYKSIPIRLFVKHSSNLMTIEPTKMETFEQLATSDVAIFLYNNLKYFNNVETAYANTDLQLDVLLDYSNRRDDVVNSLKEAYTSAANRFQPVMIVI